MTEGTVLAAIADTAIGGPTRPGPNRRVILAALLALVLGGAWLLEAISQRVHNWLFEDELCQS